MQPPTSTVSIQKKPGPDGKPAPNCNKNGIPYEYYILCGFLSGKIDPPDKPGLDKAFMTYDESAIVNYANKVLSKPFKNLTEALTFVKTLWDEKIKFDMQTYMSLDPKYNVNEYYAILQMSNPKYKEFTDYLLAHNKKMTKTPVTTAFNYDGEAFRFFAEKFGKKQYDGESKEKWVTISEVWFPKDHKDLVPVFQNEKNYIENDAWNSKLNPDYVTAVKNAFKTPEPEAAKWKIPSDLYKYLNDKLFEAIFDKLKKKRVTPADCEKFKYAYTFPWDPLSEQHKKALKTAYPKVFNNFNDNKDDVKDTYKVIDQLIKEDDGKDGDDDEDDEDDEGKEDGGKKDEKEPKLGTLQDLADTFKSKKPRLPKWLIVGRRGLVYYKIGYVPPVPKVKPPYR